jgi:hypothetical protein
VDASVVLSSESRSTAGVLLIAIVAVEWGGTYMLGIVRGSHPVTEFQKAFARAGHAHAGVLVILSLVVQLYADAVAMTGPVATLARTGIPAAAVLMPLGFFLSSGGQGVTGPNRFILVVYLGAIVLGVGAVALGFSLLTS